MRQLQAEVKKLKEQLVQALSSQSVECGRDAAPGGPGVSMGNDQYVNLNTLKGTSFLNNFQTFKIEYINVLYYNKVNCF